MIDDWSARLRDQRLSKQERQRNRSLCGNAHALEPG
jgi:hypothetical protein